MADQHIRRVDLGVVKKLLEFTNLIVPVPGAPLPRLLVGSSEADSPAVVHARPRYPRGAPEQVRPARRIRAPPRDEDDRWAARPLAVEIDLVAVGHDHRTRQRGDLLRPRVSRAATGSNNKRGCEHHSETPKANHDEPNSRSEQSGQNITACPSSSK